MLKLKATGTRGLWFAEAGGEMLPCVHKYWWTKTGGYRDPYLKVGDPKSDELVAAIKKMRRVILTEDTALNDGLSFERTGYIAIYEIDSVEFDDEGLRFQFKRRLADLI